MNDHIQQAIQTLEQEIAGLDDRRGELVKAIDALRPLAGNGVVRKRRGRRPGQKPRRAPKRNERTNERTSNARANGTAHTEPP
jgi:hypothetical protein